MRDDIKKRFSEAKKKNKPKSHLVKNAVMAFAVGGLICTLAQLMLTMLKKYGLDKETAAAVNTIFLVFIGSFLTGLGVYDRIGRVAGAGSIVPITGFANSIVSSAMEFKTEGIVFGVGAKMFNIAGPVIVFGTVASWIYGLIYFFFII